MLLPRRSFLRITLTGVPLLSLAGCHRILSPVSVSVRPNISKFINFLFLYTDRTASILAVVDGVEKRLTPETPLTTEEIIKIKCGHPVEIRHNGGKITNITVTVAESHAVVINTERLNLRSGSGTKFPVINTLVRGERLRLLQNTYSGKGWYRVETTRGEQGWVSGWYIDLVA